jgi:hypothetical protein
VGGTFVGAPNVRVRGPLFNQDGIVAISDLGGGDRTKVVVPANPDGTFAIDVPPGDYLVTYFDITQLYILQFQTITASGSETDMGDLFLTGWYTEVEGHFFIDDDGDGVFNNTIDGEQGLSSAGFPNFRLRDGTQIDRGFQFEVPFSDPEREGYYSFRQGYPLSSWLTMHTFHPLWEMTGCKFELLIIVCSR